MRAYAAITDAQLLDKDPEFLIVGGVLKSVQILWR